MESSAPSDLLSMCELQNKIQELEKRMITLSQFVETENDLEHRMNKTIDQKIKATHITDAMLFEISELVAKKFVTMEFEISELIAKKFRTMEERVSESNHDMLTQMANITENQIEKIHSVQLKKSEEKLKLANKKISRLEARKTRLENALQETGLVLDPEDESEKDEDEEELKQNEKVCDI